MTNSELTARIIDLLNDVMRINKQTMTTFDETNEKQTITIDKYDQFTKDLSIHPDLYNFHVVEELGVSSCDIYAVILKMADVIRHDPCFKSNYPNLMDDVDFLMNPIIDVVSGAKWDDYCENGNKDIVDYYLRLRPNAEELKYCEAGLKSIVIRTIYISMVCVLMIDERLIDRYSFPSKKRREDEIYRVSIKLWKKHTSR